MTPAIAALLACMILAAQPGAARAQEEERSLLDPEDQVRREALHRAIADLEAKPRMSKAAIQGLNALVPGVGTYMATKDTTAAAQDAVTSLAVAGALTAATYYSFKDDPRFQQVGLAISLPVLTWGFSAAYNLVVENEGVKRRALMSDLEAERLASALQLLDQKEEELRRSDERLRNHVAQEIKSDLEQNRFDEARHRLATAAPKLEAEAFKQEQEAIITAAVAAEGKRIAVKLDRIELQVAAGQLEDAQNALRGISPGTDQDDRVRAVRASLDAKQAALAEAAKKRAESITNAIYAAVKAGQTGAVLHHIQELHQKTDVAWATLEQGDTGAMLAGNCPIGEPLLLRGKVMQVLADGYLMTTNGSWDIIYVTAKRGLNLVDNNVVAFGAVYKGTRTYTTLLGVRNTVRWVELRTKLEAN